MNVHFKLRKNLLCIVKISKQFNLILIHENTMMLLQKRIKLTNLNLNYIF